METIRLRETTALGTQPRSAYANDSDYEECRRLHRKHGTTYYFATQRLQRPLRRRVHAVYGFVRVPDEWVDNPSNPDVLASLDQLRRWREQLIAGCGGQCPEHPVLRAFCDVLHEAGIPREEPLLFLDAMEQDLTVSRYATYEDLRHYMRGSASAVGMMMCHVLGVPEKPRVFEAAQALGEAMQLTNFLRDVGEDAGRGRIYLPLEDLNRFGVSESDVMEGRVTPHFRALMRFEIERAYRLYLKADEGIPLIPSEGRRGVLLARILYARILDRIQAQGYDVFRSRARTSKFEKLAVAARLVLAR